MEEAVKIEAAMKTKMSKKRTDTSREWLKESEKGCEKITGGHSESGN